MWKCKNCNTEIEEEFVICWNCNHNKRGSQENFSEDIIHSPENPPPRNTFSPGISSNLDPDRISVYFMTIASTIRWMVIYLPILLLIIFYVLKPNNVEISAVLIIGFSITQIILVISLSKDFERLADVFSKLYSKENEDD